MRCPENVVFLHGVPRSGTSWLAQILNSSPSVAFRFQPLFSYAFKNRLNSESSRSDVNSFLQQVFLTSDQFILQKERVLDGSYPSFRKLLPATHLAVKHVRYHNLLEHLLHVHSGIRLVLMLRHPCSVINSWLRAPREFLPEWNTLTEWRFAEKKNCGRPEEFFGFEKWKEASRLFIKLASNYPERVKLVRYSRLNSDTQDTVAELFRFCGLEMTEQTQGFLNVSRSVEKSDTYSVFRKNNSDVKWKTQLEKEIAEAILNDLKGSDLEFLLEQPSESLDR